MTDPSEPPLNLPGLGHYMLVDGVAVPAPDVMAWAMWFEHADRRVALTEMGAVRVSTVFLGLDHNWGGGPPLVFETMVFGSEVGDELDQYQERYPTLESAMAGHERAVAAVQAQLARQGPLITWLLRVRGKLRGAWRRVQDWRLMRRLREQWYLK